MLAAALKELFDQTEGDALYNLRKKAWDQFEELGLPHKTEPFRHIKLKTLYERQFCFPEEFEVDFSPVENGIVFVNGQFQEHLSKWEGFEVVPLNQAIGTYGVFLNHRYLKKEESDPFVVMNGALHKGGVFIYLPPKTVLKQPLQIIHIANGDYLSLPRVHLFAGAHAQGVLKVNSLNLSGFQNSLIDICLEENARIEVIHQGDEPTGFAFDALRAHLKRNSFLNSVSITKGSPCHRQDYRVILAGEGAEAHLNGVWQLKGHSEAHINVLLEHHAPACRSRQLFKGVLHDFSRSSFDGKIYVKKEAQQTDAFQLNNNLVLSEHAQAFCKPNLEIFADDVKASHGATIGQLREEELFYMRTRGIDQKLAEELLTASFCQEVYDCIPQGCV
jgi:Fe-S cluster assembly protein SufD